MKRTTRTWISAILAVVIIASILSMSVIAIDGNDFELTAGTVEVDGTASKTVEVALKIKKADTIVGIEGQFTETSEYLTLIDYTFPVALTGQNVFNTTTGAFVYGDDAFVGFSVAADESVIVVKYEVDKSTPTGEYEVQLDMKTVMSSDYSYTKEHSYYTARINVINTEGEIPSYTAQLNTLSSTAAKGNAVTVNVGVSHSADDFFNAAEIVLNYDSAKLELNSVASSAQSQQELQYTNNNGVLTIHEFGEDKGFCTSNYTIVFTAKAIGEAKIELESAKFVHKANANKSDLIEATLGTDELTIEITQQTFAVTLPDENITGNTVAGEGEDYTFTVAEPNNYTYTITVTVGGEEINTVTGPDANGTYTIPAASITNAIVITYTRDANSYAVTWNGNGANDVTNKPTDPSKATYQSDFTFTLPTDQAPESLVDGYSYTVSITIGGQAYYGYSVAEGTRNYTIPGTDITGAIVITVTKTVVSNQTFTVSVDGSGAGDAAANGTPVIKGEDASITLTPKAGYVYVVTATMGAESAVVTKEGNVYTVSDIQGNVVFTVTKTLDTTGANVYQYAAGMFLVTFNPSLSTGEVPTYDGNVMYYSEKYEAYCYLVITNTLNVTDAQAKLGAQTGTATNVDYSTDINKTTITDAADAQLVWNMYNGMYLNFETVTMAQFLAADQNAVSGNTSTYGLSVNDALVIINAILNNTAQ